MLIIGTQGFELTAQEREFLQHPAVAGVILFARNFASKLQVQELCQSIRESAGQRQLICVDQEGGRVQRFRDGYFPLQHLQRIGELFEANPVKALEDATHHAYVMASEVMASGLDLSFAPVADLGRGNLAIGNRAFAQNPEPVAAFIRAYVHGMRAAGMAATLKHFPGHGSVLEDTHFNQAIDRREWHEILQTDMPPFTAGIESGAEAIMMAHVVYPAVDADPAGYSTHWIQQVLRQQLGFEGVVFSDDIGMAAAHSAGGVEARIALHLNAGCDVVLACPPECVAMAVESMPLKEYAIHRLDDLRAKREWDWQSIQHDPAYVAGASRLQKMENAHAT